VHGDEKRFFVCRDGETCAIVMEEEEPPKRHVSHKSHVTKAMFPCAQARPRRLRSGAWWGGKVGMWPVGCCRPAARTPKNRVAGAQLFEPESIDGDKRRHVLMDLVVPAMLTTTPDCECNKRQQTVIQQGGAPSHVAPRDAEWTQRLTDMGLEEKMELVTQPASSPDLSVSDLGFFNALQSMRCCATPTNAVQLTEMVEETCKQCPINKVNRMWLTLQTVFNSALKDCGGNDCSATHMGKEKLEKAGRLPRALAVDPMAEHFLND